jgi:cyclopropane fatty-acyl-phospholipid synthase-like methyltransferase
MWTSLRLKREFPSLEVHGIDHVLSTVLAVYPELHSAFRETGITYEEKDFFQGQHGQYDAVLDAGLFHHLVPQDWTEYARQCSASLSSGGILFLRSFHPEDRTWPKDDPGGHVRKGYYCHYHDGASIAAALQPWFGPPVELDRCQHQEHVEALYQLRKA